MGQEADMNNVANCVWLLDVDLELDRFRDVAYLHRNGTILRITSFKYAQIAQKH